MKEEDIRAIIKECTIRSDDNSMTFPQVVAKLAQAGVERYHADLCRSEKAHFLTSGKAHIDPFKIPRQSIAPEFSVEKVENAVRAIQRGEIAYAAFLAQIMAAGCCDYFVYIGGKRILYLGRDGGSYVERFPDPV
ncbi:MAG TPA: DUF1398 domain-containing protein [Beijerinckiaceae bacterium]|nr:DUF1398 domain-containing protein [Beijerinckiaceae bacterium]HVB88819.1 DUF1398 domain-containing protein [Beijerinckiaceae bacterium]